MVLGSVQSPITGETDVSLVRRVSTNWLISEYKRVFNIDISHLTHGHQEIALYKCKKSGFRFYYPNDICGDGNFYHRLEVNEWYYTSGKWEFDESLRFIQPHFALLEIGSARGDFLDAIKRSIAGVTCTGLELNKDAAHIAQLRGTHVRIEDSSTHALNNLASYDVVASFQVLEHMPDPMNFLRDCLTMLKRDGTLIIGVPDNSARSSESIFVKQDNILNMPPHHQGLWDIPSLSFLPKVLSLQLEYLAIEPATARHHSNSYRGLMRTDLIRRLGKGCGFAVYLIGRPFYNHALRHLNQYLPAHSVLAVFRKM